MILQYDDIIEWFLGAGFLVMIIVVLALFLLVLLLPIFLLQWGLKIAKAEKRTFGAAFVTYILTVIIGWVVNFVLLLVLPTLDAYILSGIVSIATLIVSALIISKRHSCSFGGGLIALIVPGLIIAILLVLFVLVLVLGFGLVLPFV